MSLLGKPSQVVKGVPSSISLDKSVLDTFPSLSQDQFFSDPSNWKSITITSVNELGQRKILVFDAESSDPATSLTTTVRARGDFEIKSLTIYDHDGGSKTIDAVEIEQVLPAADRVFTMVPMPTIVAPAKSILEVVNGTVIGIEMLNGGLRVSDASLFVPGYSVRLFNSTTEVFSSENRVVRLVQGDVIYFDQPFTSVSVGTDFLRFSPYDICSLEQKERFVFM